MRREGKKKTTTSGVVPTFPNQGNNNPLLYINFNSLSGNRDLKRNILWCAIIHEKSKSPKCVMNDMINPESRSVNESVKNFS